MEFSGYFDKIDYYQSKGRGLSVFNSNEQIADEFEAGLVQHNISHVRLTTSELHKNTEDSNAKDFRHLVLVQDLEVSELDPIVADLVDKIIFPTYYRNIPISFFSAPDRTDYSEIQIDSNLIHHDYDEVIRALFIEQIDSLLSQNNFIFTTPGEFDNPENILYTPIELILKEEL